MIIFTPSARGTSEIFPIECFRLSHCQRFQWPGICGSGFRDRCLNKYKDPNQNSRMVGATNAPWWWSSWACSSRDRCRASCQIFLFRTVETSHINFSGYLAMFKMRIDRPHSHYACRIPQSSCSWWRMDSRLSLDESRIDNRHGSCRTGNILIRQCHLLWSRRWNNLSL